MRIVDNFLPKYTEIKRYVKKAEFKEEEGFNISKIPKHIQIPIYQIIEKNFFSNNIIPTACYFRLSTPNIDCDIRIHTDQNHCQWIGILYMTESDDDLSGTAFWEHPTYGNYLYTEAKDKEIDNIIEYEGKDESIWKLDTVVGARENRLLIYPSNMFHSRYPFKPTSDRMAAVFFWDT